MDALRDSLIAKIDGIVAELANSNAGEGDIQLQLEATFIPRRQTSRSLPEQHRKLVLGTVDIGQWKSPPPTPVSGESSRSNEMRILPPPRIGSQSPVLARLSPVSLRHSSVAASVPEIEPETSVANEGYEIILAVR